MAFTTAGNNDEWNKVDLPVVLQWTTREYMSPKVKKDLNELRQALNGAIKILTSLECLHVEAALLSRTLYRNYHCLRRDKGFQCLKMMMGSLNKYLKLKLLENFQLVYKNIPDYLSKSAAVYRLPSRLLLTWLLARIRGFTCLFLRIYNLSKEAGRWLFQRLRIWGSVFLVVNLCIAARIHAIARFVLLKAVKWYGQIVPHVRLFKKKVGDPHENYPHDIKTWLGGLDNIVAPKPTEKKTPTSRFGMVLDLIDLTEDDEETGNLRGFGVSNEEDDEIMRLYEMVNLDTSLGRSTSLEILEGAVKQEDTGQPLSDIEEIFNEEEDIGVAVESDDTEVTLSESIIVLNSPKSKKHNKKIPKRKNKTLMKGKLKDRVEPKASLPIKRLSNIKKKNFKGKK